MLRASHAKFSSESNSTIIKNTITMIKCKLNGGSAPTKKNAANAENEWIKKDNLREIVYALYI